MNPAIYLSCLVLIIGSLVCAANAEPDFESDRDRVVEIYKNADPGSIGDSNVLLFLNFLEKHADDIELTPERRSQTDNVLRQYREEKSKQPLVDGAPPQGGWRSKLLREIAIQLGILLASEGVKKATESDDNTLFLTLLS